MRKLEFTNEQLSNLTFFEADLSSMNQILEVSSQIEAAYQHVDVLINNVGGYFSERRLTNDGFELTFGLNYLGHVLLTRALLNKLNNGSESNIITISSSEHKAGKIHYGNLQLERRFFGKTAYAQSKLAGMMFVREISEYLMAVIYM
jgi:NAD(P)-dependent dehydrogenase (short-subunit alcohol dehydrogenase family)